MACDFPVAVWQSVCELLYTYFIFYFTFWFEFATLPGCICIIVMFQFPKCCWNCSRKEGLINKSKCITCNIVMCHLLLQLKIVPGKQRVNQSKFMCNIYLIDSFGYDLRLAYSEF